MMTLQQAHDDWTGHYKPEVIAQYGADDEPALSESWNDYTDSLCKDGELTALQYHYCPAWDDPMPDDDHKFILGEMGLRMSAAQHDTRGDGLAEEWGAGATHWRCTLRRFGKSMAIWYSMGSALDGPPEVHMVLGALLRDAESAGEDFEDWCDNFGYSTDSRKALRMYKACQRTDKGLRRLFTDAEIEELNELFAEY